jgi:hypothetical protein
MDLLTTTNNYRVIANLHKSELTAATAKAFQLAAYSTAVPWQRLLTVEILQLHALRFYVHNLPWRAFYQVYSLLHLSWLYLLGMGHIKTPVF